MTRLPLLLALALCACKTSHALVLSSESKLSETEHVKAEGEKHEGPWRVTTWRFAPEENANVDVSGGRGDGGSPRGSGPRLVHDQDLQRAVEITVEEHGPSDSSWTASADGQRATETHAAVKSEDKMAPAAGCALGLGFWGGIGIAALLAGGLLYLRLKP